MSELSGDKYADIIIHQLYNDSKMRTSLNILAADSIDEVPIIIKQTDL